MNSKNLYFTIFSLILLGFISSCAENSNKCSPSYASNIEQLNEKLYDSYANVAVRKNNTTSDDIITPEYFGGSYVKANKLIVMVKNGSLKGIEDIKKRLGTDSNVTFVSCTYSLQELKELNAKLQVSFAKKAALRDEIGWVAVGIKPIQNRIVVYLNNASNKNISKFKNEICNSDKIIFDQLEIEPIEIQKDTVAIDNEISANVRGKDAFRKIICSANIISQSVSQSAHGLGLLVSSTIFSIPIIFLIWHVNPDDVTHPILLDSRLQNPKENLNIHLPFYENS